ncbi:keratinocyte-associated protein 3 [Pristis pectinata]|uniref:keratinocyte-associated protein 3 n=1 Tax=Pristis pectinata TaxID=685728 RepID=UPI00223CC10D|nr:keratinocyte-associated protein 3 [Pristis pectinata]XP_051869074.1 keratinocyte-associated protein 3 [Pristis pectinata]
MCGFDKVNGPRQLMRKGIALIFIGHINFIIGAIVHGTVLRHISKPDDQVTVEYSVANIISVISGLLSIATGIIAILVSRNLLRVKLHWGMMLSSLLNTLTSLACAAGLILAIVLTVSQGGRNLISGCNSTMVPAVPSRSMTTNNCPFDTTRIYDTTLALWIPSMVLSTVEGILSARCFVVAMILRGIGPCGQSDMVDRIEEEDPAKGKKHRELETYKLISSSREVQL